MNFTLRMHSWHIYCTCTCISSLGGQLALSALCCLGRARAAHERARLLLLREPRGRRRRWAAWTAARRASARCARATCSARSPARRALSPLAPHPAHPCMQHSHACRHRVLLMPAMQKSRAGGRRPLTLTLANRARLGACKLVDPAMTLRARLALPRGSAPCPIPAQVASLQLERGGSLARVAGGRPRAELPCAAAGQGCLSASALAFAR